MRAVSNEERSRPGAARSWITALRRYALFMGPANLAWETLQLPLYTIWREGTIGNIAFSVVHCTAGDLLIALACLVAALILLGRASWPGEGSLRVAAAAVALGLAYAVYSEWLNVDVRGSWAYSDLMPVVPPLGTGLSPLLQWLLLPPLALSWAGREQRRHAHPKTKLASPTAARRRNTGRGGDP